MKCRHPELATLAVEQLFDPAAHFFRSLVGEGDRENVVRCRELVTDDVGNADGDDPRLARAGAGEDQQRAIHMFDGFTLGGIQRRQGIHWTSGLRRWALGTGEYPIPTSVSRISLAISGSRTTV